MTVSRRMRGWMNRNLPYMLTCEQVDNAMVDYLDGALRRGPRRRVELHRRLCPDCRAFTESYAATIRATRAGSGGDAPPPPGLVEAVTDRLDRRPPHKTTGPV